MLMPELPHCLRPVTSSPGWKSGLLRIGLKTDVSFDFPSSLRINRHALIVLSITGLSQHNLIVLKFLTNSRSFDGYFEREVSTSNQTEILSFKIQS